MLSPEIITTVTRTTSEPDLCAGDLGKRTMSNASGCSKSRSRTSHMHLTAEELVSPRFRSASGITSPLATTPNGSIKTGYIEISESNNELSQQAFAKLKRDLDRSQQDLRSRDDQCRELTRVRDEVDLEVEELTASLFEEAHKMVYEANVGRATAEKLLHETKLKLEGVQAEVSALKLLVITSTPANPSKRTHKRSPSAGQICSDCETYHCIAEGTVSDDWTVIDSIKNKEVDPVVFQLFLAWLEIHCPLKDHPFLTLIHKDDIVPCLRFPNDDLAKAIYKAVQNNTLTVEAVKSKSKQCALTKVVLSFCSFRIRTSDSDQWFSISSTCRARIVAVADFLTFLRYIRQGIIKKDINVLYWEMVRKRVQMSIARLGLHRNDNV